MQLCNCYHAAVRRKGPQTVPLNGRVTMVTAELKVLKKIGAMVGQGFDTRGTLE